MKKPTKIDFRCSAEIRSWLEKESKRRHRSMSAIMIELIEKERNGKK